MKFNLFIMKNIGILIMILAFGSRNICNENNNNISVPLS